MLQHSEGILPNVHLDACTREQLQAAHPDRFFPCPETDVPVITATGSQQQHSQPDAEAIAGLQQGTAAWHRARSCHITGSQLSDLLGFSCPVPNRALVRQQVYHRVAPSTQAGYSKLLHCIGSLRGDAQGSTAAAPAMEPFGQLACTWGSQHEAAAHHTLLQHAPPGSLLIDTGFVSPAFDAQPDFYSSITAATPANRAIGSLGDIPLESVSQLRLGCSLDGLLLTPVAPAASGTAGGANSASGTHSSSSSSNNRDRGGSGASGVLGQPVAGTQQPAQQQQQQQQEASQGLRLFDAAGIRRAPPYAWAAAAGYAVSCVEVKCPTPYWSVKDRPWAFACVGQDRNRPYLRMRAGHYCQSQLSMLVTGTECCVYVVWTRGRTWITHVPINRAWLHTCLHLLIEIQQRYVSPDTFTPPPTNLFWDPGLLQDGSELSSMYRRFIEATAVLSAAISSRDLPDPLYSNRAVPWGVRQAAQHTLQEPEQQQQTQPVQQQVQQQQQPATQQQPEQDSAAAAVLQGLENLMLRQPTSAATGETAQAAAAAASTINSHAAGGAPLSPPAATAPPAAAGPTGDAAAAAAAAAAAPVSVPPPGWQVNSSGRALAHWVLLDGPDADATAAATAAAAAAAAPLGWCQVHTCMVKSLPLPLAQQQPLQQDRWFLDHVDPDSSTQAHLGVAGAWLDHPLLGDLWRHPRGVQALMERLHKGLPPLHVLVAAAAAAAEAAAAAAAAGSGSTGGGGGSGGGSGSAGGLVGARSWSPGKLVLALLLKTEKLHCLDLSPVWKLLPQSALDCLEVWRVAAQSRAAAAAARAAATARVPAGVGVGAEHCGGINAASTPAAAEVEPVTAAAEAAETGAAAQVSVRNAADQLASHLDSRDRSQQAGSVAAPAADNTTTTAAAKQQPHRSSSAVSSSSSSSGRRDAAPWASAFASWQQRQQLRQQRLVAALRRCVGAPAAAAAAAASLKHAANNRHGHAPSAQQQARPGPTAGVCKAVAQPRREMYRQGGGSGSDGRGSGGRLAGSLRGMGLADLLQDSRSDLAAAAAAAAAAAVAAVGPVVPHAGVTAGRGPVVAAAAAVMHPLQQTGQQQHASSASAPVAAPQRQGVRKSTRPPPKQQSARRLVAAAQQQQRAARLARYQEAFRAWSLQDMLQEVSDLQVQQQLLQQPLHEVLQDILTAHEQAADLLAAQDQQQQQAGRMRPAARRPAVVAAAAAAVPTDRQTAAVQQQQDNKSQEQPAKKQKQPRKPRQPKVESAAAAPAVSRRRIQPFISQQHQQQSGTHVADGGAQAVAAGGEAAAAAARLASSSADQAAFTVVGPAAVLACL